MYTIKQFFFNQFKLYSVLVISLIFSVFLLMVRIKLNHSFFYLFLIWNLFLAIIPFVITSYLTLQPNIKKMKLILWFGIWLLFLPNAPYIITDLMHLRLNPDSYLWLDILVVTSFACNGLLLFYLSVLDMKNILKTYIKKPVNDILLITLLFLSSFGIYLGRFLRYNSWEILSNPKYLILDIFNIALQPITYREAWLFTFLFGIFLNIGFWMFTQLYKSSI
ncbi:hypothetical protein CJ739_2636 [Mariniflexile rhizosphaerae]|uniref:DUF1361 domain-containing protein n=2 Tax=unclassified Mariniflexile TaxID=2643887 RepID=UPI000CAA1A0F|nr:hypothetical protein CJ739_2636 [Mariniflexile sp. TRM1-10]PLB18054.1 MAG: putative membrane protein [Flavobacteriaceae bacterium FS1-H7996/R]